MRWQPGGRRLVPAGIAAMVFALAALPACRTPGIATAPTAAAAAEMDTPPGLRLDDRARPTRMEVDLTLDPGGERFTGEVTIALEMLRPARILWLHASGLEIAAAELEVAGRRNTATVVPGGSDAIGLAIADGSVIPAGSVIARLRYGGAFQLTETAGIFKQTDRGDPYLFTSFEATEARRAIPCFDEPAFKIPWQLTLRVPAGLTAVANTPERARTPGAGGTQVFEFEASPPLPSYLVAFAVGPFELVDAGRWGTGQTPLRIIALKGRAADASYAAEVTGPLLARMEDYFGIPYPYAKLDSIAVPQTVGFSAMENAGLITYVDRLLLIKPADLNEGNRRTYADIAAHELAHMWFGDFVTMAWWDDLWLNEGFASWMGDRTIEAWQPGWGYAGRVVERRADVMEEDALLSARQVRQPIASKHDIEDAFDGITYEKGASLLTQFERWLGAEPFRAGVRNYLQGHAWGNATSRDFLAALSAAGDPSLAAAFSTFLDQAGVPLVSVDLRCEPGAQPRVSLQQRRFLPHGAAGGSAAAAAEQRWQLPVRIRHRTGGEIREDRFLLAGPSGEVTLSGTPGCPEFLLANDGELGYYVAAYPPDRFRALLADAAGDLSDPERLGVLRDAALLTRSGDLPLADALAAAERYARHRDRQFVEAARRIVSQAGDHLVADELRPRYARFVREVFGARAGALGFEPRAGESADEQLLRPQLLGLVGDAGEDPELRQEADRLARRWLQDRAAVPSELLGVVLQLAAIDGGGELYDRLLQALADTRDRRERRRLHVGLASFRNPDLARRALALTLDPERDPRETAIVLFVASGDPANRQLAYDFVKANFDALAARLPETVTADLSRIARGFCDAEHRADAERFFTGRSTRFTGGPRTLAQTLEEITLCAAAKAAQERSVAAFLTAR